MGVELALGAAALAGGVMQASASKKAAKAQAKASEQATAATQQGTEAVQAEQRRQYDQSVQMSAPYREAGVGALQSLSGVTPEQQAWDREQASLQAELSSLTSGGGGGAGFGALESITRLPGSGRLVKLSGTDQLKAMYDGLGTSGVDRDARIAELRAKLARPRPTGSSLPTTMNAALLQDRSGLLQDRSGLLQDRTGMLTDFTAADFAAGVDPGYAFRLAEGQKALDRAASGAGRYYSGRALKDLTAYNQGMGAQEYQAAYDRFNQNQNRRYAAATAYDTGQYGAKTAYDTGQYGAKSAYDTGQYNALTDYQRDYRNQLMDIARMGQASAAGQAAAGAGYANAQSGLAVGQGENLANIALGRGGAQASAYQNQANAFGNTLGQVADIYGRYQQNQMMKKLYGG